MINGHVTVAILWAWWANSRSPEFQAKKIKNNFSVTVGETFNRSADLGL